MRGRVACCHKWLRDTAHWVWRRAQRLTFLPNSRCCGVPLLLCPLPSLPQKQIDAAAAQRAEADALYQELTAELQAERSRMAALEVRAALCLLCTLQAIWLAWHHLPPRLVLFRQTCTFCHHTDMPVLLARTLPCAALPRLQGELTDTQSRLTSSSKEVERLSGELVTANASSAHNSSPILCMAAHPAPCHSPPLRHAAPATCHPFPLPATNASIPLPLPLQLRS